MFKIPLNLLSIANVEFCFSTTVQQKSRTDDNMFEKSTIILENFMFKLQEIYNYETCEKLQFGLYFIYLRSCTPLTIVIFVCKQAG